MLRRGRASGPAATPAQAFPGRHLSGPAGSGRVPAVSEVPEVPEVPEVAEVAEVPEVAEVAEVP
ncbi:hypothetical protein FAGKG844_400028 [Frankia sp. AgKG'84/4]